MREEASEEEIHRLRIALERLRVWALLGRDESLADELRWLRRKAAAVRDLDVRLALVPPAARPALRRRRPRRVRELRHALDGARAERLGRRLTRAVHPSVTEARAELHGFARRALAAGKAAFADDAELARMHALRRAVRRVRFALEWLGDESEAFAAFQRQLGLLCDRLLAAEVSPSVALAPEVLGETLALLGRQFVALRPALRGLTRVDRTAHALRTTELRSRKPGKS